MSDAYYIATFVAAGMSLFSACCGYFHAPWVVKSLTLYRVPRSWWPWLSHTKVAGAAGLLGGFVVPWLGVAAGVGLVLYFLGAVITVIRAGYYSHLPAPLLFLAPMITVLALG